VAAPLGRRPHRHFGTCALISIVENQAERFAMSVSLSVLAMTFTISLIRFFFP
jgi:hypothetical protein